MRTSRHWILALLGAAIVVAAVVDRLPFGSSHTQAKPAHSTTDDATVPPAKIDDQANARERTVPRISSSTDATIDAVQQRLEPLARRGGLKAAAELSRAAMRCYKIVSDVATLQSRMNSGHRDSDPFSVENGDKNLAASIEELQAFGRTHCETISRQYLAALARSAAKNAAYLGDVDARMCVIEQRFLEPRAPDLSPDEQANGQTYLANYEASAFDSGDWRIVILMAARTLSIGRGPIHARTDASPGDPASYLRAMQLLRLGADGTYASRLDAEIAKFVETTNPELIRENRGLAEKEIADAKAWALEEFATHFSGSPRLTEQPVACGDY
jgi:hypothetical protein